MHAYVCEYAYIYVYVHRNTGTGRGGERGTITNSQRLLYTARIILSLSLSVTHTHAHTHTPHIRGLTSNRLNGQGVLRHARQVWKVVLRQPVLRHALLRQPLLRQALPPLLPLVKPRAYV
jgi:hypothetical protein